MIQGEDEEFRQEGMASMFERLNLAADNMEKVALSVDEEDDDMIPEKWSVIGKVMSLSVIHVQYSGGGDEACMGKS